MNPAEWTNGLGHVHTFPNEGSTNGRVVIAPGDIIILPYCRYVVDEIRLEIRDGFIREIDGGLDAKLMRDWLAEHQTHAADLTRSRFHILVGD